MAPSACIAQTIANQTGQAILWALAGDPEIQKMGVFDAPSRPGFGGRQAFSGNSDRFYGAIQSVVSLSAMLMKWYDLPRPGANDPLEFSVVAFPVIIIEGELFEADIDEKSGGIEVNECDQVRLHWRGSREWPYHATIDVVRSSIVDEFVEQRSSQIKPLLERMRATMFELRKCVAEKDFSYLTVSRGPRGVIGPPPLVREFMNKWDEEKNLSLEKKIDPN